MRRILLAAAVPLLLTTVTQLAPAASASPVPACAAVAVPAPPGAKVESVSAERKTDAPAFCQITVTLTHDGGDHVKVVVGLPDAGWTGRLQALGGSAYAAGEFGAPFVQAVKDGYSAVTTDAGVSQNALDTSWALTTGGKVNQTLLTNFATRSAHEEAVVGKAVTERHYQRPITYSYWTGCSTGGRQGYSEAQNYADDFDGILANAPAVQWSQFAVATLWPQVVMNNEHDFPSNCVLSAFQKAAVQACDARDGVTNGIVDRPDECSYDPRKLIGTKVVCDGQEFTVTAADAEVMRKIWAGPTDEHGRKLWAGLPKGADYTWVAGTQPGPDGTLTAPGFIVAVLWVQSFLEKQPGFDTSKLTYAQYTDLFRQSVREYDGVIGTADPDLSAFRRSGGKLLTYVGTADQLIPPGGTLYYRQQVERAMGGSQRVNDFYRLFLAPGVEHCGGGLGPQPSNPLGALVDWVEHGKAPATLAAATADGTATRDLCAYPRFSRYTGHGDPATAASYRCR
ncbi:tannase/feruloyl esterase family alpha/beta hydrolase [Amycolatopsis lexingtonensis]|uniref:tannase/feruloyl esterase family alpha/beta hydrolase n=1 Tax=Amycolatopsis lexingtonensis TaxID=218822 RepID=UPI003F704DA9